jgi:hypothetical protein
LFVRGERKDGSDREDSTHAAHDERHAAVWNPLTAEALAWTQGAVEAQCCCVALLRV